MIILEECTFSETEEKYKQKLLLLFNVNVIIIDNDYYYEFIKF